MTGELNETVIAAATDEMERDISALKATKKQILAARLQLEDILMRYQSALGSGTRFSVGTGKILGKIWVTAKIEGEQKNVFVTASALDEGSGKEFRAALEGLNKLYKRPPVYAYSGGCNFVTFTLSKR